MMLRSHRGNLGETGSVFFLIVVFGVVEFLHYTHVIEVLISVLYFSTTESIVLGMIFLITH